MGIDGILMTATLYLASVGTFIALIVFSVCAVVHEYKKRHKLVIKI